jgi:hypothetical protein
MTPEERLDNLLEAWQEHHLHGRDLPASELCHDCPELAEELARRIGVLRQMILLGQTAGEPPTLGTLDVPAASAAGGTGTTTPPAPDPPGLVPGYEILGELGRGGMGVVYKARHLRLKRLVALKMIKAGVLAQAAELDRFRREAEAVAHLQHPNIVQIYEIGEHAGGPFLSFEFVSGGSLAERLRGAPLPLREATRLVETLARAVHYAHQRGIIHRDLKPANVLLSAACGLAGPSSGSAFSDNSDPAKPQAAEVVPKLTDFGLAKQLDADQGQTQSGVVMGTPGYMAPEQAAGRTREVGPAADVWALGVLLYECLTGRPPFRADTMVDLLLRVLNDDPVPPRRLRSGIPRDLETITLKCLRKEPGRRYGSAAELADDLTRFLEHEPIRARPVGAAERAVRWVRRRAAGVLTVLLVLLALGSATGGLWLWQRWQDEQEQASEARLRAEERGRAEATLTVGYFANMTRRNGEPEGVGPLTEAEARRRHTAYKVSRRGSAVERVEVLNTPEAFHRWNPLVALTTGEGDDNSAAAHSYRLTRDDRGGVVEETAHDAAGKLLWKLRYEDRDLARYTDGNRYPHSAEAARTAYLRIVRDEGGFAREVWWSDRNGQPRPSPFGVYGVRLEHDSRGLRKRMTYLDADGRPMLGRDRTATRVMLHDARANPVEEACFGVDGQPVRCADGYHKWKTRHDEHGNQVELTLLDPDGKPAVHRYGYHRLTCGYDQRGNVIDSQTFAADGKPVVMTSGYARLTRTHDAQGTYQGQTQWVVDTNGAYVPSRRLDARGKTLEQWYFTPDGRPTRHEDGCHRWTAKYDERGNAVEVAYFAVDGKPTKHKVYCHRWTARYDERGNRLELTYFDPTGRPGAHEGGDHHWVAHYDERNNPIEERFFGLDGKPVVTKWGYARLTRTYDAQGTYQGQTQWVVDTKGAYVPSRRLDGRGKVLEQWYFTPDGQPSRHVHGWHRSTAKYDERGNKLEVTYFDLTGRPMASVGRDHRVAARYDERNNQIEERFFGLDDKPVVTKWGYARLTRTYDAQGKYQGQIQWVLDTKGKYVLSKRLDARGKVLEQAYFTPDGQPSRHADGYHRSTSKYDERGNVLELSYFDSEGRPTAHEWGYHRWVNRYDGRNNRIEERFFGVDGRPVMVKHGYARLMREYDEGGAYRGQTVWVLHSKGDYVLSRREDGRGKVLEEAFFSEDGKPQLKFGYHRATIRYDARGNALENVYYGAGNKPILMPGGYHKLTRLYNGQDKLTQLAWFGLEGEQVVHKVEGCHKVKVVYDGAGRRTERRYFGTDGRLMTLRHWGYARMVDVYDRKGQRMDEIAHDVAGKPLPLESVIEKVEEEGQAEALGLRVGDVLLTYNGKAVRSPAWLTHERRDEPAEGPRRELRVRRGDQTVGVQVSPGSIGFTLSKRAAPRTQSSDPKKGPRQP